VAGILAAILRAKKVGRQADRQIVGGERSTLLAAAMGRKRTRKDDAAADEDETLAKSFDDVDSEEDEAGARLSSLEDRPRKHQGWDEDEEQLNLSKLPVKVGEGDLQISELETIARKQKMLSEQSLVWTPEEREAIRLKEAQKNAPKLSRKARKKAFKKAQEEDGQGSSNEDEEKKQETPEELERKLHESRPMNAAAQLILRESKKTELATLAEQIMENPEKGLEPMKGNNGKIQPSAMLQLLQFTKDNDKIIRKLAILSLIAVFKDIIPGYKINLDSVNEDVQMKKTTHKLHKFEKTLLENYKSFLKTLGSIVSKNLGSPTKTMDHRKPIPPKCSSEAVVAIRAMCTLLVTKTHFNFRENLVANIVPRMNSEVESVRLQCCACASTLLEQDTTGDATLELVTYISKYTRTHNHGLLGSVHSDMIKVCLHCDLKADLKDTGRLDKIKKQRKKKRKKMKEDDVLADMAEAQASADLAYRHSRHAEALRELFTMYLRVLKRAPSSLLLPIVLRGISRYVHLINIEIAQALVTILTQLIKADQLPLESGLQSVHTIALTLRGPGSELKVDETEFVAYLYRSLMRLASAVPDRDRYVPLTVRCIEAFFLGRKLFQHNRVASMVTRLSVLAMCCSPHACLALIACMRELMTRYSSVCRPLVDGEEHEASNSLALGLPPSSDDNLDPILLEQDASVLWPLAQLRFHYHPHVRSFAEKALKLEFLTSSERPNALFDAYDPYREGGFNPPIQKTLVVSQHGNGKKKNRKRNKQ